MTRNQTFRKQIFQFSLVFLYALSLGAHNFYHISQVKAPTSENQTDDHDSEGNCVLCLGLSAATAKLFYNPLTLVHVAPVKVFSIQSIRYDFYKQSVPAFSHLARPPPAFS